MALKLQELTKAIIGAAIEVHKALGPGLLESAYEECLCHELRLRGLAFENQQSLPVAYKGVKLDCGVNELLPVHDAQLLTYMRLGGFEVGLLINFHVAVLKEGLRRKVL